MAKGHAEALEHAFSTQAAAFEDRRFNRVFTVDVEWIFERLELRPDQSCSTLPLELGTPPAPWRRRSEQS